MSELVLTRPLFVTEDPERIRAQLAGTRLSREEAGKLRDEVSTDEITPIPVLVHFDATLGRFPYVGLQAGEERPIGRDAVRQAGIDVVVGGRRWGKGSSREHSPVAERAAGVRLVIAESFERIYRQNADNVGLFTSTDFGLLERIARGEPIAVDELVAGRDALAAAILRAGGLLAYGRERLRQVRPHAVPDDDRPRTLFQKIVARHALSTADTPAVHAAGDGGFVRADRRFIHEYYTGMCAHMLDAAFDGRPVLHEPGSIVAFEDHLSYVHRSPVHLNEGLVPDVRRLSVAHRAFVARHGLAHHGYLQPHLDAGDPGNTGSVGISHAVMLERHVLPGELVVGTDSHTTHSGAIGCVAYGVGTTDMANAFVTGAARIAMPAQARVTIDGTLPPGTSAKDLMLHLLALPEVRRGALVGLAIEFDGDGVRALSIDERATLTNMCAEIGGFTGIVAPDAETARFLRERRGVAPGIAPWMHSDAGAEWAVALRVDASRVSPMVARPGDPGRGLPLSELIERPAVDIAYGGSCTAGKREDFAQYHAVLAWAAERGLRVPAGVKLYLQFGTDDVRAWCERQGFLATFEAVGAELLHAACGACANCGPGSSERAEQVTVSAINRNFPGRSGPGQVWLASPATVAASAIAGRIVSFAELQARHASLA